MKKDVFLNNPKRALGNNIGTFVVRIEHCSNGTWQGKVIWVEENRTERFRSALELLRLMDEAMGAERQLSLEWRSKRA